MTEEEIKLLKHLYLCDSSINTTDELTEEAIATLEHYFEFMIKDDLYKRSRQLVIPYLALIAVRRCKTMNWVNAKDKLPEDDGEVLACEGKDVFIAHFDGNDWVVYVPGEDDCLEQHPVKVSHWMPLPEPPEGGR